MSSNAVRWALRQRVPALAKIVLVVLASHHNGKTHRSTPSRPTLSTEAGMSLREVDKQLLALRKLGLVATESRTGFLTEYTLRPPAQYAGVTPAQCAGVQPPTPCTVCRGCNRDLPKRSHATPYIAASLREAPSKEVRKKERSAAQNAPPAAPAARKIPPEKSYIRDVREILFTEGLATVRALVGRSDKACRALLGRWRQLARDDCAKVLDAIERAADIRPSDPVAFIAGCLRDGTPSPFLASLDEMRREIGYRSCLIPEFDDDDDDPSSASPAPIQRTLLQ